MSILPSTYILRQPVQHRVTLIEGGVEISYIGRTYDNYYPDGLLTRYVSPESHDQESFPIIGCYLIEEMASDGTGICNWEILPEKDFRLQFEEYSDPGRDHRVRPVGAETVIACSSHVELVGAEILDRGRAKCAPQCELVSRPSGSNDEWTVQS